MKKVYFILCFSFLATFCLNAQTLIANPQNGSGEGGELLLMNSNSNYNPWNIDNYMGHLRFFHSGNVLFNITPAGQVTIPNGNVGIGTSNPAAKLEVDGELRIRLANYYSDKNVARILPIGYSGITGAMNWTIRGAYQYANGIAYNSIGGDLDLIKSLDGNTILATKSDGTALGNVGIGTTSPDSKLTVKGDIHTNEVKVDLLGAVAPDYVFANNYYLKPLKEVENYIAKEKHLPNIPSAKDMETEGILLKELNLKLLEKIEELTLYTIQQEKEIKILNDKASKVDELEDEVLSQKSINQNLEDRLQNLEALLNSKKH